MRSSQGGPRPSRAADGARPALLARPRPRARPRPAAAAAEPRQRQEPVQLQASLVQSIASIGAAQWDAW